MGAFQIYVVFCIIALLFCGISAAVIAIRFLKESKIRIVIDGDDMDSFLRVMHILANNALGVSYNDEDTVIMEVKIYRRKLETTLAALHDIPNIDVLEIR